jgi:vacuolar-type H+-ATPase subunit H
MSLGQLFRKRGKKTKPLREREFNMVGKGLDEKQVVEFVHNLLAQSKARQKESADSLRLVIDRAVRDVEQAVASIMMKAQADAENEAARIIDKANQQANEIRRKAELVAQKQAKEILSEARKEAAIIETEARQKAQPFLLKAREEIEEEIRRDYNQAHSQLLHSLQNLMNEEQNIAAELKEKREKRSESSKLELKEQETTLVGASGEIAPRLEASAVTHGEVEPEIAIQKKVAQSIELDEEVKRKATEARKAQRQSEKEAKLGAKEEAKREAEEAKKVKKAQRQAEKEAKLAARGEAKRQTEEAKKVKKARRQAQKEVKPGAENAIIEKVKEPAQLEREVAVSESVEGISERGAEQHRSAERSSEGELISSPLKLDEQALYDGEVELSITAPVDPAAVSRLYNQLQKTPEIKILYTRGSWHQGIAITVSLDRPVPLIGIISSTPDVEVTAGSLENDRLEKGQPGSLLGAMRKGVKRIALIVKAK